MDCETKILIKNITEAIEKSDDFAIVLAILNFIAFVIIAIVQIRLQKQQIRQQEYEIYRKLYPLVCSANKRIQSFLHDMLNAFWGETYRFDKDFLQNIICEITDLKQELQNNQIDYELKLSKKRFDHQKYLEILSLMLRISQLIDATIKSQDAHLSLSAVHSHDRNYIENIIRYIDTPQYKTILKGHLETFVEQERDLQIGKDLIKEIKKQCRVD